MRNIGFREPTTSKFNYQQAALAPRTMAALTSTIYTDPARWQTPDPGHAACLAVVGGGVNTGSQTKYSSVENSILCAYSICERGTAL